MIYRKLFVSTREFNFGSNDISCQHSAAFLRTCKMVHEEGTSILYQQNSFKFTRNKTSRNPFWSTENREVGYLDMRQFLTMIGSHGRSNLRIISINFEDGQTRQSWHYNPYLTSDNRFASDGHLIAALKLLAQDCQLYKLNLWFNGRNKSISFEFRFLDYLRSIRADDLTIDRLSKIEDQCKGLLYSEITRPEDQKLYPDRLAADKRKFKKPKSRNSTDMVAWM
jgi:hypothetical protein